jgi:hypothetical protein
MYRVDVIVVPRPNALDMGFNTPNIPPPPAFTTEYVAPAAQLAQSEATAADLARADGARFVHRPTIESSGVFGVYIPTWRRRRR